VGDRAVVEPGLVQLSNDLCGRCAVFALGQGERQLGYATHHRDIVRRFGRFPHRNAILGRASRPDEIAAGADKPW